MAETVIVGSSWSAHVETSTTDMRRAQGAAFVGDILPLSGRGGIVRHADNSLLVQVNSADIITITRGSAVIPGNAVEGSGVWIASLSTNTTIALDPRHVTNPRIDLVVMRQLDVDVVPTHGVKRAQIEVLTGTPDPAPSAPALPTMAVELGRVTVYPTGGAASVVDRTWASYATALGGFITVPTAARLPVVGVKWQHATAWDTGAEYRFNGTTWQLYRSAAPAWVNLAKASPMTSGTLRYCLHNGYLYVHLDGAATIPNASTTTVTQTAIPVAYRPDVMVRTAGYFGGEPGTITLGTDGHVTAYQTSGSSKGSISGYLQFPILS